MVKAKSHHIRIYKITLCFLAKIKRVNLRMKVTMRRLFSVLLLSLVLLGCSNFKKLSHEMKAIDTITHQYTLILDQPISDFAVVIEQIKDINKSEEIGRAHV